MSPDRARALAEGLPGFLDELRAAGYRIGPSQHVAASDLLLALAALGSLADDLGGLGGLLGPIVCRSPGEQVDFRPRFDRWAARLEAAAGRTTPANVAVPAAPGPGPRWRHPILAILILVILGLIGLIALVAWPRATRTPAQVRAVAVPSAAESKLEPEPPPAPEAPPLPMPEASTSPARWATRLATLVAVSLLLWAGWLAWGHRQARRFLRRMKTTVEPEFRRMFVQGVEADLYRGPVLDEVARELRRRLPTRSTALNVAATVEATARKAGWFTPVSDSRRALPEYLVLVNRAGGMDQQAELFDAIIDGLEGRGVLVDRYHFDGDPRSCEPDDGPGAAWTLPELGARHPDHRLLIFSDGAGLIGLSTGEPAPWVGSLAAWPERALLTPEPASGWGYREVALAREGLTVLPATSAGLRMLGDRLGGEPDATPPEGDGTGSAPSPAILRGPTFRWIDPVSPGPETVDSLLAGLRGYLGEDGFGLLAACAVYPELSWHLTLFLGANLTGADGATALLDEPRLEALTRLPWFRQGSMPDWLRSPLIAGLGPVRERAIRGALGNLLLSSLRGPASGFRLEIARQPLDRLGTRCLRLISRRASPISPLRDPVFATFLRGKRPSRLAVGLPPALLGLLQPDPDETTSAEDLDALARRSATMARALNGIALLGCVACWVVSRLLAAARPSASQDLTSLWLFDASCFGIGLAGSLLGWLVRNRWSTALGLALAGWSYLSMVPGSIAESGGRQAFISFTLAAVVIWVISIRRRTDLRPDEIPRRVAWEARALAALAWAACLLDWLPLMAPASDLGKTSQIFLDHCPNALIVASLALSSAILGHLASNLWATRAALLHMVACLVIVLEGEGSALPASVAVAATAWAALSLPCMLLAVFFARKARPLDVGGRGWRCLRVLTASAGLAAGLLLWPWVDHAGMMGPAGAVWWASSGLAVALGIGMTILGGFLGERRIAGFGLLHAAIGFARYCEIFREDPWNDRWLELLASCWGAAAFPLALRAWFRGPGEPAGEREALDASFARLLIVPAWLACAVAAAVMLAGSAGTAATLAATATAGLGLAMFFLGYLGGHRRVAGLGLAHAGAALALLVALGGDGAPAGIPVAEAVAAVDTGRVAAPTAPAMKTIYHKQRAFRIPFNIAEADRGSLQQIQLYASGDGGDWQKIDSVDPEAGKFTFRAPSDGEYRFAVRTLDKKGRLYPAADAQIEPAMKVIVNTTAPRMTLEAGPRRGSLASIRYEILDEYLDRESLRLEYLVAGRGDWVLVPIRRPAPIGQETWDAGTSEPITARLSVADRAGNTRVMTIDLPDGSAMPSVNPPR